MLSSRSEPFPSCVSLWALSFLHQPPPPPPPHYLLLRITSVPCLTVGSFPCICLWLSLHCHVKVCSLTLSGASQIPVCLPCYYSYLLACLPCGVTACLLANIWMCDQAVLPLFGATIEYLCVVCLFQLSCVSTVLVQILVQVRIILHSANHLVVSLCLIFSLWLAWNTFIFYTLQFWATP